MFFDIPLSLHRDQCNCGLCANLWCKSHSSPGTEWADIHFSHKSVANQHKAAFLRFTIHWNYTNWGHSWKVTVIKRMPTLEQKLERYRVKNRFESLLSITKTNNTVLLIDSQSFFINVSVCLHGHDLHNLQLKLCKNLEL